MSFTTLFMVIALLRTSCTSWLFLGNCTFNKVRLAKQSGIHNISFLLHSKEAHNCMSFYVYMCVRKREREQGRHNAEGNTDLSRREEDSLLNLLKNKKIPY